MDSLYQEHILDHYKHPRNRRLMEHADVVEKGHNASCGDDLVLYLKWEGDVLADVSFEGFGCAISQSGASILTEKIKNMKRDCTVVPGAYGHLIASEDLGDVVRVRP